METGKAPHATQIHSKTVPSKLGLHKPKINEKLTPKARAVSPRVKNSEGGDKAAYIDTSQAQGNTGDAGRTSSPSGRVNDQSADNEKNDVTHNETHARRSGAEVASQPTNKYVHRFFDYYNEALRNRLIRQLEESVRNTRTIELDFDSPSDSDEDAPPTMSVWGVPLKQKDDDKKTKWKGIVRTTFPPARKKSTAVEEQRAARRLVVLKRFRKKTRIIIFCIRCIREHCFKFRERSELTPYMTALNYIDYRQEHVQDLMFDRSQFRAAKKMRFPEEAKRILSMPKCDRTEQEIYSAQIALRNIKGFAVLPARMQYMIAQCGQYESYESRRVITRESHPPSSFYFILFGTVVAMKYDEERAIAIAVDEFIRGDCFEENVMISDCPREVTILTKEACEFMSISSNDYKNIFMQGGVHNLNDPDQDKFLRSLKFMQGWPIGILQEHPSECRFHYFKRGAVLSDDTHKSMWLIIVKSGSLSVLKKLKKVGPYEWKKNSGIKPLTEKEKRLRKDQKEQWRRFVLPDLGLPLRKGNEIEQIEERVDGKPKPFQHPNIKVQMDQSGDGQNKIYYPNYWAIKHGVEKEGDDKKTSFTNINQQFLYLMSSSNDAKAHAAREVKSAGKSKTRTNKDSQKDRPKTFHPKNNRKPSPIGTLSPALSDLSDVTLETMSDYSDLSSPRTPTSSFEDRLRIIHGSQDVSDLDVNPQFVTIQTLIKGDVWGLADLILEDQPSFMVISNGADCVLLNKTFYKNHCSEKLGRRLEQDLCPYPTDERLQDNLQTSVDWDDYRKRLLTSTMDDIRMRRHMRDTAFEAKPQETF